MAKITAAMVKELREQTKAGMMDCKKALQESDGDMEKAVAWLRQKGLAVAAKRAGRATAEGIIYSYIHAGGKLGVLVEVNCETDFVANTDQFQQLAKDIAMQIAAANPVSIRREDVPADFIEKEREILVNQAKDTGKPEHIIEKIVDGRLEKMYKEVCLLEQPFVKNPDITIQDLLNEMIGKLGENITVRRFVRYQVGAE